MHEMPKCCTIRENTQNEKSQEKNEQAGAELCQAQVKGRSHN